MIRTYKNHRTPKTSLGWDEYFPKNSVYIPSKEILELRERAKTLREKK